MIEGVGMLTSEEWPIPRAPFTLRPGRAGIVVVDMQYYDTHPEFGLGLAMRRLRPGFGERYFRLVQDVVVPNVQRLLAAWRRAGLQVIYLTFGPQTADGRDFSPLLRARFAALGEATGLTMCYPPGTPEHRILDEIAPLPGDLVLNKNSSGAFNSTPLDQILRSLDICTLVFTGVTTEACVETTARDAADRGYECLIVEDATGTFDQDIHRASLRTFEMTYGLVESSEAILRRVAGLGGDGRVAERVV
jgi:nicotinamidase-related amidase